MEYLSAGSPVSGAESKEDLDPLNLLDNASAGKV